MKKLLLPLLLLGSCFAYAQQGTVSGKVQYANNTVADFANVLLLQASDSSLVKGVLSDATGSYRFDGVEAGNYRVVATILGYNKARSKPFAISPENTAVTLPALVLTQTATALKEVVVEAQRPLIEQHLDKTVMNVENSIVAAGNTALEVLQKAPGVSVDQNDNISMRGRAGVIVMIDGKQVPMSGSELANMLRGMSADALDKIELITNPSAKYDAAGNAGIIDIKLKKDKRLGTNGSVSSSLGYGQYAKSNQGLQLNHRTKSLNLFGSYNYVYRRDFTQLDIYRRFFEDGVMTMAYDQQNRFDFNINNHSVRVGADYYISPETVAGVVVSGFTSDFNRYNLNKSVLQDAQQVPQSYYLTDATAGHDRGNQSVNFNIKHSLDTLGREITADLDYIVYQNGDVQNFDTRKYSLSNEQIDAPSLLYGTLNGDLTIKSAKVDYSQPLKAIDGSLQAGLKSSLVNADNDLQFFDRSNGGNELDRGRSNHFIYDENINAAYLNASKKWEKMSLQLGLRAENTIAKGLQVTNQNKFKRNYTQLFPSAFVGYTVNKKHDLGLSLSRRINRPSYNQLNPFKNYLDPTTYSAGNPYLRPELSYAFEFTHTYDQRITTKLSYSYTTDVMVQVLSPDPKVDTVVAQTFENLARNDYYGLTIAIPFSIGKWFNSINNVTAYYGLYRGNLANTELNNGRPTLNLNSSNTFNLPNNWSAEITGVYRGKEVYGFLDVDPLWFLSFGVQKQFWDKKASLKLNVTDAFYTNKVNGTTILSTYSETFHQTRDSQVATLSFNYRFGRSQVAPARRRTGGAEEEKNRAGGN